MASKDLAGIFIIFLKATHIMHAWLLLTREKLQPCETPGVTYPPALYFDTHSLREEDWGYPQETRGWPRNADTKRRPARLM